jgi:hypothetical protein
LAESHPDLPRDPTPLTDDFKRFRNEAIAPPTSQIALPHSCKFIRETHFEMEEVVMLDQVYLRQTTPIIPARYRPEIAGISRFWKPAASRLVASLAP